MRIFIASLILTLSLGAAHAQNGGFTFAGVSEFARITEGFSILDQALRGTQLGAEFTSSRRFTLIAPSDQAFRELPEADLASLLDDPARLTDFLDDYIVPGGLLGGGVLPSVQRRESSVRTLGGTMLHFERSGPDQITVNGVPVVGTTEIETGTGLIIVVDSLIDFN